MNNISDSSLSSLSQVISDATERIRRLKRGNPEILTGTATSMVKKLKNKQRTEIAAEVIRDALLESYIVILGWGSTNRFEERKAFVLGLLGEMKKKVILKPKMHPSRGRYENFIQHFSPQ